MISGILSAGSLIGLMIDMKGWFKDSLAKDSLNKAQDGLDNSGLDRFSNSMNNVIPSLGFTPWFYIAVIAFLVAAFFCFKRMQATK